MMFSNTSVSVKNYIHVAMSCQYEIDKTRDDHLLHCQG